MEPLSKLGFDVVGYGCTTCIGNSGPLAPEISQAITEQRPLGVLGALGQPQLRGSHPSRLPHELPRVAAARRRVRARGHDGHRPARRSDRRTSSDGNAGVPARPLADRRGDRRASSRSVLDREMFVRALRLDPRRRRALARAPRADRRALRVGSERHVHPPAAVPRRASAPTCHRSPTSTARACSRCSATASRPTTSRRPATSARRRPRAEWLIEHGVEPRDFNSYGARRGNHEVMVRGTFANVRLRNQLAPGTEGGVTRASARRRADDDLRRGDAVRARRACRSS